MSRPFSPSPAVAVGTLLVLLAPGTAFLAGPAQRVSQTPARGSGQAMSDAGSAAPGLPKEPRPWDSPATAAAGSETQPSPPAPARRLLLAHTMLWYEGKPLHSRWGWHWTMDHFDPETITRGRREAASHYRPLIGLYDSGDPQVLEYHVLLMKLAGIDGVILDWYGPDDFLDYGLIHRNSLRLIPLLRKAGLRFAVCYEDQTVSHLIQAGRITAAQAVDHGQHVLRWLQTNWFSAPAYVQLDQRPLFLVFGPQYYKEEQWQQLFAPLPQPPAFFTLHERRAGAIGAFDWPQPAAGLGLKAVEQFYDRAPAWPAFIPAAFPRFHDIYPEAGAGRSFGSIPDEDGKVYRTTLDKALRSGASIIQLVTWNDWGEGTAIEPSVEFGFRDLEQTQRLRRKLVEPRFRFTAADLRLPLELLRLRRAHPDDPEVQAKLDAVAAALFQGRTADARRQLRRIDNPAQR